MVKSAGGGSSSVAPFLRKCYEMVDDCSTDSIISWSRNGDNSFVIWDTSLFSLQLLPNYFKHSNFSSFIRQLNIYGFRKIDADRWEFANDGFAKGQKELLKNVTRRKNVQTTEQSRTVDKQESTSESQETAENSGLWEEVDILKDDKKAMAQELINLRQFQEITDTKMVHLKDKVQGMEESQQEMLSFLVMVIQNPNLLVQLLQPKENSWRKPEGATILEEVTEEAEFHGDGLPLVTYQPPLDETAKQSSPSVASLPAHNGDLNDFLRNADMMKFCVDENHVPLIIPDLYDDGAWEKLLLLSPSKKKKKRESNLKKRKEDGDVTLEDVRMESDKRHMLELIVEEMEKADDFEVEKLTPEKSRNLELITEQMGLLASNE